MLLRSRLSIKISELFIRQIRERDEYWSEHLLITDVNITTDHEVRISQGGVLLQLYTQTIGDYLQEGCRRKAENAMQKCTSAVGVMRHACMNSASNP